MATTVTRVAHSCVLLDFDGHRILTDPWFSQKRGYYPGEPHAYATAAELPSHTIFNAMASYELTQRINLRLNVNNVSDKLYARSLNNNSNRTYLGEPRSYLLTAEFKF